MEVEAEVDAALGRVPSFPPSPGPCFPHRTWRALRQVQWAFIDLFLEHVSVYRESRMKAQQVSQPGRSYPPASHRPMSWSRVHVLDALCDLTTQWYAALKEAPTVGGLGQGEGVMIDTRQQSMVVRELSRLANTTHAAELEVRGGEEGMLAIHCPTCILKWRGMSSTARLLLFCIFATC